MSIGIITLVGILSAIGGFAFTVYRLVRNAKGRERSEERSKVVTEALKDSYDKAKTESANLSKPIDLNPDAIADKFSELRKRKRDSEGK